MKAYANALKSKKADTEAFAWYFYNAPTGWQIYEPEGRATTRQGADS